MTGVEAVLYPPVTLEVNVRKMKRIIAAAVAAALIGALLLPGRAAVEIHFDLNDVVNAVGMAVLIGGIFIAILLSGNKNDD